MCCRQISHYFDKVFSNKTFPLPCDVYKSFNLKLDLERAVVTTIDKDLLFQLEINASDIALAVTLNQGVGLLRSSLIHFLFLNNILHFKKICLLYLI